MLDLGAYMSNSIRTIMAKAYKSVLSNPREAKFAFRMQTLFQKSEKRRRKMLEQEELEVPAIPHQQYLYHLQPTLQRMLRTQQRHS